MCVCVCTTQPGRLLVEAHSSGEMLSQQSTAPFSTVSCYSWLGFFYFLILASGAPRGEIWRGAQQEGVR